MDWPYQAASTMPLGPLEAELEVVQLRAASRRQEEVIRGLNQRCATLRRGAQAVQAENARLRAELHRLRGDSPDDLGPARVRPAPAAGALDLPADPRAAGAARMVLGEWLRGHAPPVVVADAQLIATELISNSVRHADLTADDVVRLGIELGDGRLRVRVEDRGTEGVVAPRHPDVRDGRGLGLNLVIALAASWGVIRDRNTCVWAELAWPGP